MIAHLQRKKTVLMVAIVLLVGIGMYGLLPQLAGFEQSIDLLSRAQSQYVLIAAFSGLLAVAWSAGIYFVLARRNLNYAKTLLVQLAGLLVNRVMPAGVGGIGLNYLYLRNHRHSRTEASAVVFLNNTVGLIGHAILLCIAIAVVLMGGTGEYALSGSLQWLPALAAVAGLLIVGLVFRTYAAKKPQLVKQLKVVATYYRHRPQRLAVAVALSCLLTLSNVISLCFASRALGIDIDLIQMFIVFSLGIAVGTVTPTPGGIGGVEAGLVAGLIAYGLAAAPALAIVLLYRLVTFWLGLAVGAVALIIVQHLRLIRV